MSVFAADVEAIAADGVSTTTIADDLHQVRLTPPLVDLAAALPGSLSAEVAASLAELVDLRLARLSVLLGGLGADLQTAAARYDGCEASASAALGGGC